MVAIWLGDTLLGDQHHRDGISIVVAVLESTQTCDLVRSDEDGGNNMIVTIL